MARTRYRIRFSKDGDLRYISHRDLLRTLERLFRRAGLQLAMSQGFHPKPRMSFPAALAVGMVGANEWMEIELNESLSAEALQQGIGQQAPAGLTFLEVQVLAPGEKIRVRSLSYEIEVPEPRRADVLSKMDELLSKTSYLAQRDDGSAAVDVRPALEDLTLNEDRLRMRLLVNDQGGARPRAVLAALGLGDLPQHGHPLIRTAVEFQG